MSVDLLSSKNRGLDFVRMCIALGATRGNMLAAHDFARMRWGGASAPARVLKVAVASGGLNPASDWGSELEVFRNASAEFFSAVSSRSIIGQVGARQVPLRVRLIGIASGSAASWVGEGSGKGLTKTELSNDTLTPLKLQATVTITKELLESVHPASEGFIRQELLRAVTALLDSSFVDPTFAGTPGVAPASITSGVSAISGSDDPQADLLALVGSFGGDLSTAVLIMSPFAAVAAHDASSLDLGATGGSWRGIRAATSINVPDDVIVLVDSQGVAIGEGETSVNTATAASMALDTTPSQSSTVPTASSLVSLWQVNAAALRVEHVVNWITMRDGAVSLVDGATWSVPQGQT